MVLAIIVGIGSTLFSEFTSAASGQPTLEEVLAMALAALTLLGLSIFGPGIASGLVSGAPQLGAGAAVGTGLTVAGMAMVGAGAAQMAVRGGAGLASAASAAGGAGGSRPGPGAPAPGGPGGGPGPGSGGGSAQPTGAAPGRGPKAWGGGESGSGEPSGGGQAQATEPPTWARDLKQQQALAHGASLAAHGLASGDDHSGGASPSLSEQS
jgi:type IV secretion system protein TrbL